jgi:LacI family transcriptional regulator
MAAVTIKDVAEAAGVGIATVSRVARQKPTVAPELRRRVEAAMSELGYEPNAAAQSMRTRTSRTIACAIRDSSIPEFASFVRAAEAAVRRAGYTLLLTNTDDDPKQELELIKVLGRRRVDGMLLTRSQQSDESVNKALSKLGVPIVYIDRDPSPIADSVVLDHRHGIKTAVDHLVSLGHQRIALVTGRPTMRPARERLQAFELAFRENGLTLDPNHVYAESFFAEQSFHYVSLLLSAEPRPTAIIAGGMALLPAVLRAVKLRGLKVGKDIAIIAGCDSDLAELSSPAITAVRWDIPAWGRICAQLLLDRINGGEEIKAGRQIILPTELVIRESSVFAGT